MFMGMKVVFVVPYGVVLWVAKVPKATSGFVRAGPYE